MAKQSEEDKVIKRGLKLLKELEALQKEMQEHAMYFKFKKLNFEKDLLRKLKKLSKEDTMKTKKLKLWNGAGHGKVEGKHLYIAAYNQKHAAELASLAQTNGRNSSRVSIYELKNYYSAGTWGYVMRDISPSEPCVYAADNYSTEAPVRIL